MQEAADILAASRGLGMFARVAETASILRTGSIR
jgi:hypothetical protein